MSEHEIQGVVAQLEILLAKEKSPDKRNILQKTIGELKVALSSKHPPSLQAWETGYALVCEYLAARTTKIGQNVYRFRPKKK